MNKLVALEDVWKEWVEVLPKQYYPDENVTVDQQWSDLEDAALSNSIWPVIPQIMVQKLPLCDSKTSYVLNQQDIQVTPEINQGMRFVIDFVSELRDHHAT